IAGAFEGGARLQQGKLLDGAERREIEADVCEHRIDAGEVENAVRGAVHEVAVIAEATLQRVRPEPAEERVVAVAAEDDVVAVAAAQGIETRAAVDEVIAPAPPDPGVRRIACQ